MTKSSKGKELIKATDEWASILGSRLYELAEEGSDENIYHTQPVDIDTFAESPEYLGIRKWRGVDSVLSEPQREFLEKATDFENGVTDFVLWV